MSPFAVLHIRTELFTAYFIPQGILNHCFDDIENFMGKLQQTADAATVLNQKKKKKKKSKKQSAEGRQRCMGCFAHDTPVEITLLWILMLDCLVLFSE